MEQVDVWKNTKRFWGFLKKYKLQFFTMLFIVLVVESTFILEKYLLKIIVDSSTQFANDALLLETFISVLWVVASVILIFLVIRTVGKFIFIHLLNRLDGNVILDLKRYFFNHIVHLDHGFHATNKTGSLISKMTRGGRAIEGMLDAVAFSFSSMIFQLLIAIIALSFAHWLASVALFVTAIVFVGYSLTLFKIQLPLNKKANDTDDAEKGNISDIFTNIDSIKYYGKEEKIKERYENISRKTFDIHLRMWDYYRFADSGQSAILTIGAIFLLGIPIYDLIKGTGTVGDIVFVFTVFATVAGWMFGFVFGVRNYYRAMIDFNSLYYYDQFENAIKDLDNAPELALTRGSVTFDNVSFGYGDQTLFENFTLEIKPNEKVAFVGHSGGGKSTLVKLLYRLYDVDKGAIMIDGTDIRTVQQESLRSELAIVPQEAVLFDDTIWNNIKFSNSAASDGQVRRAIAFAQLDKLIEGLPKKEQTIVGERGVRLSGGEKQRVSIARALLADKKILVLDEATSALDSQTEHEIQQDLKALMKGRTSIMIAHRLSTIMAADKIVVLDEGKIVQMGTHKELIKKKGQYKNLWELQRGGYID